MNRFRKILCKKLPASTVLESITASVIFMIVFVMAMDTLTRLLTFDSSDADNIVMENELGKCRRQILLNELKPETRTYLYEWGEINVTVSNYKGDVFLINMVATGKEKHRQTGYLFLQANSDKQVPK